MRMDKFGPVYLARVYSSRKRRIVTGTADTAQKALVKLYKEKLKD